MVYIFGVGALTDYTVVGLLEAVCIDMERRS
jgi:hypothetical protein